MAPSTRRGGGAATRQAAPDKSGPGVNIQSNKRVTRSQSQTLTKRAESDAPSIRSNIRNANSKEQTVQSETEFHRIKLKPTGTKKTSQSKSEKENQRPTEASQNESQTLPQAKNEEGATQKRGRGRPKTLSKVPEEPPQPKATRSTKSKAKSSVTEVNTKPAQGTKRTRSPSRSGTEKSSRKKTKNSVDLPSEEIQKDKTMPIEPVKQRATTRKRKASVASEPADALSTQPAAKKHKTHAVSAQPTTQKPKGRAASQPIRQSRRQLSQPAEASPIKQTKYNTRRNASKAGSVDVLEVSEKVVGASQKLKHESADAVEVSEKMVEVPQKKPKHESVYEIEIEKEAVKTPEVSGLKSVDRSVTAKVAEGSQAPEVGQIDQPKSAENVAETSEVSEIESVQQTESEEKPADSSSKVSVHNGATSEKGNLRDDPVGDLHFFHNLSPILEADEPASAKKPKAEGSCTPMQGTIVQANMTSSSEKVKDAVPGTPDQASASKESASPSEEKDNTSVASTPDQASASEESASPSEQRENGAVATTPPQQSTAQPGPSRIGSAFNTLRRMFTWRKELTAPNTAPVKRAEQILFDPAPMIRYGPQPDRRVPRSPSPTRHSPYEPDRLKKELAKLEMPPERRRSPPDTPSNFEFTSSRPRRPRPDPDSNDSFDTFFEMMRKMKAEKKEREEVEEKIRKEAESKNQQDHEKNNEQSTSRAKLEVNNPNLPRPGEPPAVAGHKRERSESDSAVQGHERDGSPGPSGEGQTDAGQEQGRSMRNAQETPAVRGHGRDIFAGRSCTAKRVKTESVPMERGHYFIQGQKFLLTPEGETDDEVSELEEATNVQHATNEQPATSDQQVTHQQQATNEEQATPHRQATTAQDDARPPYWTEERKRKWMERFASNVDTYDIIPASVVEANAKKAAERRAKAAVEEALGTGREQPAPSFQTPSKRDKTKMNPGSSFQTPSRRQMKKAKPVPSYRTPTKRDTMKSKPSSGFQASSNRPSSTPGGSRVWPGPRAAGDIPFNPFRPKPPTKTIAQLDREEAETEADFVLKENKFTTRQAQGPYKYPGNKPEQKNSKQKMIDEDGLTAEEADEVEQAVMDMESDRRGKKQRVKTFRAMLMNLPETE
ncbi:MAG: hypothetical protein M1831_003780 [Alyxoria varia]|nr:MAG: hypothetical protein M1831_003780 [Alyxoria varia]